jgi:ribosomal protein S18 acetylase RimI-like enzyme
MSEIEICFATHDHLKSWMDLVDLVRWNFPGLETQELLDGYRETVIKNIDRRSAICAIQDGVVVGVILFSIKHSMLSCMAVHPDFRKMGIATRMINLMLEQIPADQDVVVTTFRENDEKGIAPRALYKKLGFVEDELNFEFNYPHQKFVLHRS